MKILIGVIILFVGAFAQASAEPNVAFAKDFSNNFNDNMLNDGSNAGAVATDAFSPSNSSPRDNLSSTKQADSDVELRYGGTAGMRYRSNIYRQKNGATSDAVAIVAPAFAIRSDFDKHDLQVKGRVEAGYYASEQNNNYVKGDLQANSRLDVAQGEALDLHGRAKYDNVEIGGFIEDVGNPQNRAAVPISYKFFDAGADYSKPLGEHVVGRTGVSAQLYDYDNTARAGGGKLIQDDRDRNEYHGYGLLGVPINVPTNSWLTNSIMPFVSVDSNARIYHRQVARTAIYGRDSVGFGAYVGAQWNNREVDSIWANGKIGFMNQNYAQSALPDINDVGFNFEGAARLEQDTILQLLAYRQVNENTLIGASGALQTRGQMAVIHGIDENWALDVNGRYTLNDFQINPAFGKVGRKDNIYDGGLGVNYYIVDPLYARADYQYINRNSSLDLANYNESRAMLSLGMKY